MDLDELRKLQEKCAAKSKEVSKLLVSGSLTIEELIDVMERITDLQRESTQTLIDGITFLDEKKAPDENWWQRQHDQLVNEIDYYDSLLNQLQAQKVSLTPRQQKLLKAIVDSGFKNPGFEGLIEIYEALS